MYKIYLFIFVALVSSQLRAQEVVLPASATTHEERKAFQPGRSIRTYMGKVADQKQATEKLQSLYDTTIEPNDDNISYLSESFAEAAKQEQRLVVLHLLSTLYAYPKNTPENRKIASFFRNAIDDPDELVSTTALMRYARLAYFADTVPLLKAKRAKNLINDDDLFGELAHLFAFAPDAEQKNFIEEIAVSKNKYSIDIIAARLKDRDFHDTLSQTTSRALQELLENNQPTFSVAIGEFSLKEAIIYADWLHALALLSERNTRIGYDAFVMSHLDQETSNPKKAISFFSSPQGKAAAARIGGSALERIFARIDKFLKYQPNPKNETLFFFASDVIQMRDSLTR